jgi:transposase
LSAKIHARVGAHGLPVRLALSAGQAADMRAVPELLEGLAPPGSDVVADRGYDYAEVRQRIRVAGGRDHLPTTRQKREQISVAPALYRQRDLIERCFNRLKHFRRLATRFDKLARNYLSTVALAAIGCRHSLSPGSGRRRRGGRDDRRGRRGDARCAAELARARRGRDCGRPSYVDVTEGGASCAAVRGGCRWFSRIPSPR